MYCAQNNRVYCSDCNKSYIPYNYSNHLKSKGHNNNVMKKRCCSCDNNNLTCSMNKLSLKSDDSIKTTIDNLVKSVSEEKQIKEKNIDKYENIDYMTLMRIFMKNFSWNCTDDESFKDAKSLLKELQRIGVATRAEVDDYFSCCVKVDDNSSTAFVEDIDPDILCEILRINLEKVDKSEMDNIKSEAIINELLRTKKITQKQYSVLCRKIRNC